MEIGTLHGRRISRASSDLSSGGTIVYLISFIHCRFDDAQQSMALVGTCAFLPLEKATWGLERRSPGHEASCRGSHSVYGTIFVENVLFVKNSD